MKIWLQSGSALSADALTPYGRLYEESLARHLKYVARPDTQLQTFGIAGTPYGKDRYHTAFHRTVTLMLESVMRAEPEGFDAVAVINTFDHGYYELREVLRIPVVFITESSLYLACQLAPRVGFVTHNEAMLLHTADMAKRYGFGGRLAEGAHLGLTYEDFPKMYDDPAPYLAAFTDKARRVVARGADVLLVAGNPLNMFLVEQGLRDVDGVPVLDGCAAVVKTAEMMVDLHRLGIRRSSRGLFTSPPDADLAKLRTMFE